MKKNKLLVIVVAILFGSYVVGSMLSNKQVSTKAVLPSVTPTNAATSNCITLKYGFKKPDANIQSALFLQETLKRGFEGIVSKRIENGQLHYYVNTNLLPPASSPYYLWVLDIDRNGKICKAVNVGQLTREPRFGAWLIDFGDNFYTDDGQFFVITQNGFGASSTDNLTSFDWHNPFVILTGSYSQLSRVSDVKLQPNTNGAPSSGDAVIFK